RPRRSRRRRARPPRPRRPPRGAESGSGPPPRGGGLAVRSGSPIKLGLAAINPHRLAAGNGPVRELRVDGMSPGEAQGFGRAGSPPEVDRGAQLRLDFVAMVQVEVVASDEVVERVVEAIVKTARTGKAGDGLVLVLPVEAVHRIRTGESEPRDV